MEGNGAETLRRWRDERGMTQDDIAAALNVTPGAVSQWENGRTAPRRAAVWRLESLLDAGGEIAAGFGYAPAKVGATRPDDLEQRVARLERDVHLLAEMLERSVEQWRDERVAVAEVLSASESQSADG